MKFLYGLDALFLLGYGTLCVLYPDTVATAIMTKITDGALPFAEVFVRVVGTVFFGLGAMFLGNFLHGTGHALAASVWHLAFAGLLSYILQKDIHVPLGIDSNHLVIGAAFHALFGLVYLGCGLACGSTCCATEPESKKPKQKAKKDE